MTRSNLNFKHLNTIIVSSLKDVLLERNLPVPSLEGETSLLGRGSLLDSLGLVTLITTVEAKLYDDFGLLVTLTDSKAFSQKNSPFKTINTLTDYVMSILDDNGVDNSLISNA